MKPLTIWNRARGKSLTRRHPSRLRPRPPRLYRSRQSPKKKPRSYYKHLNFQVDPEVYDEFRLIVALKRKEMRGLFMECFEAWKKLNEWNKDCAPLSSGAVDAGSKSTAP